MAEEEEKRGELTITLRKQDMWKYSTFVLAAILVIGAFWVFMGDKAPAPSNNNNDIPADDGNSVPSQPATVDDDAVLGDKNAPVTLIEFSDYECPFCGKFFQETYLKIKSKYVDTGKVKVVFRDFPLSFHQNAQVSAEAAECVGKAGGDNAYYKMHDKIFSNQAQLSKENLVKWARELGYEINTCLNSGEMASEVAKDLADGQASGVQGTPSFFVDGMQISGAQPYQLFEQAIEAALAKK